MAALSLAACGSSQPLGGTGASPAQLSERAQAARFLMQATFGPTPEEINTVGSPKNFDAWLTQQKGAPVSLELPYLQAQHKLSLSQADRIEAWWRNAVNGPDQLRQRMAFALSEIMVVSDQTVLGNTPEGVAYYYDLLAQNALGNFRDLLTDVTLSPAMGRFLSMFQNRKPDPANGIRSDENYAREVMQLFSIGLVQLKLDGSPAESTGKRVPTFTQSDVANLARVFTGWSWAGATDYNGTENWTAPMQPYEKYHDETAKVIVGGAPIPAGMQARQELNLALDTLFNHPNVGPFIGKQLIKRLVTSNPSPAYVARVAQAFNDNGHGVRGDLFAVARAILLDAEAQAPPTSASGKLREPLLRVSQLWRAFHAQADNGRYDLDPAASLDQSPLGAASVFNFFRPEFRPAGVLAGAGLVAPEFEITDETTIVNVANEVGRIAGRYRSTQGRTANQSGDVLLDFRPWEAPASQPEKLLDNLDLLLMSGTMPAAMRQALLDDVSEIPADQPALRVDEMLQLIVTSPQYAVQE